MIGEIYTPTEKEKEAMKFNKEVLKVSGDGIFSTLQGEGITAGEPAVFLRLHRCNLKCGQYGKGWYCDAWYTWDETTPEYWKESVDLTVDQVADQVFNYGEMTFPVQAQHRLVITGGEPLLQQTQLLGLLSRLDGWAIEIETNGTIVPREEFAEYQINCSPKLTASGNELRAAHRPLALKKIASFDNAWFKFVITGPEDVTEMNSLIDDIGIDYGRVILMSEGTDVETLHPRDAYLERVAKDLGCRITRRNQIFWFGNERAT